MKRNFDIYNSIKSSEIILHKKNFKEAVEKATNKGYAENVFLGKLNSVYLNKQNEFNSLSRFLIELDNNKELGLVLNESKEFDKFNSSEITNLAHLTALHDFLFENYKTGEIKSESPIMNSSIIWKGENQTEFVQLVYGLYHSGILTNNENEKTKLVKQIANYFNIQLSKNWQSNLSKAVKKRNIDYEPQIIEKIKSGYEIYKNQINAKKNKSK